MNLFFKSAVAAIALANGSVALAQHEGHQMPMPAPPAAAAPDPHAGHDMISTPVDAGTADHSRAADSNRVSAVAKFSFWPPI